MYDNDNYNIRATAIRRKDKRFTVMLVCFLVAAAVAIGVSAGFIGYAAGKNNMTVIYQSAGETTSTLSSGGEKTIESVVEEVADSVVEINCSVRVTTGGWRPVTTMATSAGSGVIISEDGKIVTNHHVVDGAISITVRLRGGETYTATLVNSDAENDIAVIDIEANDLPFATFGDSDALKVGQTVIVIGNPLGVLGGTVTDGILSALHRDITIDGVTMSLLQTNASINSGNSGGGMFDLDGRLIGVVNAKSTGDDIEGLGFAIPANTVVEVIKTMW